MDNSAIIVAVLLKTSLLMYKYISPPFIIISGIGLLILLLLQDK